MRSTTTMFLAEEHDRIEIIPPALPDGQASLGFEGRAFLSVRLSKEQVIRIHHQASAALASWPEECYGFNCSNPAVDGCYVTDPASQEQLPACESCDQVDPASRAA